LLDRSEGCLHLASGIGHGSLERFSVSHCVIRPRVGEWP
jgi:hypothetical protein